MKIGRIIGTVTATVKDARLSGITLLVADVEDGRGNVLEASVIAADTCSAGVGDIVLLVSGSAARLPAKVAGIPVDMAVAAIVDHIDMRESAGSNVTSSTRKK
ncbi:MAG: EutN/CcmL family microcompartment protein [Rhizobiaceae bacterium]